MAEVHWAFFGNTFCDSSKPVDSTGRMWIEPQNPGAGACSCARAPRGCRPSTGRQALCGEKLWPGICTVKCWRSSFRDWSRMFV